MIKYSGIEDEICLEAVKQDGHALRYVLDLDLFIKIANELGIKTDKN